VLVERQLAEREPRRDWLQRPLTTAILAVAAVAAVGSIVYLRQPPRAPDVPGYAWSTHPRTLVVAYRCGTCGARAFFRAAEASDTGLDVLVLSSKPDGDTREIGRWLNNRRVFVFPKASAAVLGGFLDRRGHCVALVERGRIVKRSESEDAVAQVLGRAGDRRGGGG
jgi:hypothetical protein